MTACARVAMTIDEGHNPLVTEQQEIPMRRSNMRRKTEVMAAVLVIAAASTSAALAAKTHVDTGRDGRTIVTAPGTRVAVLPKRTAVRVEAPYTSVRVNTEAGRVRIRVPYYNGDISW